MSSKKKHIERSHRSHKNNDNMANTFFSNSRHKADLRALAKSNMKKGDIK